jgi:hypothetical protein
LCDLLLASVRAFEVGAEVVHGEADVRFQRLQFTAGIVQDFHPREVAKQVSLSARQLEVVGGGVQHGEQFGKFVGDCFWQSFHGGAPGGVWFVGLALRLWAWRLCPCLHNMGRIIREGCAVVMGELWEFFWDFSLPFGGSAV